MKEHTQRPQKLPDRPRPPAQGGKPPAETTSLGSGKTTVSSAGGPGGHGPPAK